MNKLSYLTMNIVNIGKKSSEFFQMWWNGLTDREHEDVYEDIDKEEVAKSVVLLDLFTKTFCRYKHDYQRFNDLTFRCGECPFQKENGDCLVKLFKSKYAPDYKDFGSMGDL